MSNLLRRVLLLVFLCLSISACEKEELNNEIDLNNSTLHYEAIELEVTKLVNNYRSQLGLSTLTVLNLVSKVAETHSKYMVEQEVISHDNFEVRLSNLMENTAALNVGENVAFGYQTAEELLKGWLNSPTHRRNIEAKSFTDFGISAKKNASGHYYFTQIFIERN